MTTRLIVLGKASTITRQLAALQAQGLCPSGPKIINRDGGPKSRHDMETAAFRGGQSLSLATVDGKRV